MTQPPPRKPAEPLTEQRIDFAYTIFWTKMVRTWNEEKRKAIAARVARLTASPEFVNNAFERKFEVEGLDGLAHAGASIVALKKVLEAFEE
jgi:hypothetical protein